MKNNYFYAIRVVSNIILLFIENIGKINNIIHSKLNTCSKFYVWHEDNYMWDIIYNNGFYNWDIIISR